LKNNIPGEFLEMKGRIIDGLSDNLESKQDEEVDVAYTRQDIDRCDAILMTYLASVFEPGVHADTKELMAAVEAAVLAINELNDDCDQSLVDTEQRDGLCDLICSAASQAGLAATGFDITEEWREW